MFSKTKLAEYRKAVVAGVGAVAELLALGVLHGTVQSVAQGVIAVATATGVYTVPNAGKEPF